MIHFLVQTMGQSKDLSVCVCSDSWTRPALSESKRQREQ